MSRRVDQMLAGFAEGDAISSEAVILRDIVRATGAPSDIFADTRHVSVAARGQVRDLGEYRGTRGDVLIHHYSIESPAVQAFLAADAARVLLYHNITPAHFFDGFDDRIAAQLRAARAALREHVSQVEAVWAVSDFNACELGELGATDVKVLPLLFSPSQFDRPADRGILEKFGGEMTNFLCVGRVAPNKNLEQLLEAFAWYYRTINRQSRLIIVGSERSAFRYFTMLEMHAAELDLPTVYFERFASPEGLSAYYETADAFITCSRHEGYCLPLVEAMHKRVPVIAPRVGGMPEALGGGGIMFEDASPRELAVLMQRIVTDAALRQEILANQQARMDAVRSRRADLELQALLAELGSDA